MTLGTCKNSLFCRKCKELPSLPYLIFNFGKVSTVPTADFFVSFCIAVWLPLFVDLLIQVTLIFMFLFQMEVLSRCGDMPLISSVSLFALLQLTLTLDPTLSMDIGPLLFHSITCASEQRYRILNSLKGQFLFPNTHI